MRRRAVPPPAPPPGNPRRPRLFTLLLLAFALVIVLGVGGMAGFYTLAAARFGPHTANEPADPYSQRTQLISEQARLAAAQALAEYFALHGSWLGVDAQVLDPQFARQRDALAGYTLLEIPEGHICCGSAGTYNMLQPELSGQLRDRKLKNIASVKPDLIATGNIGCMTQLQRGSKVPVVHTVELLDWATGGPCPASLEKLKDKAHPLQTLMELAGAR